MRSIVGGNLQLAVRVYKGIVTGATIITAARKSKH